MLCVHMFGTDTYTQMSQVLVRTQTHTHTKEIPEAVLGKDTHTHTPTLTHPHARGVQQ